jgi:uncharacterized membrane protein
MKKSFLAGLVLLLPLALTLTILIFLVNFLTKPFVGVVKEFLLYYGLFENGFLFLSPSQIQQFVSQLLIIIVLFFATVLLGILARWVFFHYLFRTGDYIFHRIPIVRSIYKTSKEVIQTIFETRTRSFKQVVLIPFPNHETRSIGFVTRENIRVKNRDDEVSMVAVFVPTTPNPTSGFLMMFKEDDIEFLDTKVEDAFKYIISCGVIQTPFKKLIP